jgi:hypothetical protein
LRGIPCYPKPGNSYYDADQNGEQVMKEVSNALG